MKVWSWRVAVIKSGLPPKCKHLLLTLSVYMSETGHSCFPSYDVIQSDTGLARPTIAKYLKECEKAGWLRVRKHGFAGRRWAQNEYEATVPEASSLGELPNNQGSSISGGRQFNPEAEVVQPMNSNTPIPLQEHSISGGFSEDGGRHSAFRIDHHLTDAARAKARAYAPGWDMQHLMRIYDADINAGKRPPPEHPSLAFPGWVKAYTKGRPPA